MEKPREAKPDDLYFTVAFFGFNSSELAAKRFFHAVVGCFQQLDCPPDKIVVGRGEKDGRTVGFKRGAAKLLQKGFADIGYLCIQAMLPEWKFVASDFLCSADWSLRFNYSTICVNAGLLNNLDPMAVPMLRELVEALSPEYGIGYVRKFSMGPNFFAIGVHKGV